MLPLEQVVRLVFSGLYWRAGLELPAYSVTEYRSIEREIALTHKIHPLEDPEAIVAAEGFILDWAQVPRCGCCSRDLLLVRWRTDPRERALIVHHERAHAWLVRRGLDEATEADAWLLTARIALPLWLRAEGSVLLWASRYPLWFLDALGLIPEG